MTTGSEAKFGKSNGSGQTDTLAGDDQSFVRPGTISYDVQQEVKRQADLLRNAEERPISTDAVTGGPVEPADQAPLASPPKKKRSKKSWLALLVLLPALLAAAGAAIYYALVLPGATRVRTPVSDQRAGNDSHANEYMTKQAVEEAQRAYGTPQPQAGPTPTASPDLGALAGTTSSSPYLNEQPAVAPAATPTPAEAVVTNRRSDHAIRFGSLQPGASPSPTPAPRAVAEGPTPVNTGATYSPPAAVVPPLGTMLPIRTLGSLLTIRNQSMVRMSLTREMRGPGWSLPAGTTLVGSLGGSDPLSPRAFVSLDGFIDPRTGRFVGASGEVKGADGAQGLLGRRRTVGSGWTRALSRIGVGAVGVAETALNGFGRGGRGGGNTIILGGGLDRVTNPMTGELSALISDSQGRQSFVEVAAGTPGFVLINNLPDAAKAVAAPVENLLVTDSSPARVRDTGRLSSPLTDEETAELLTNGNRESIIAAFPRMSPEFRRVALLFLADSK